MAIRIQQAGLPELYAKAAILAGQAQRARELEQQAIRRQEQIQSIQAQRESQQIALEQQRNMRLLDAQLDLEMYERSKRWEIDKMQLRSQVDFQREEQKRQRIIDDAENAMLQIEKEIKAGNIDRSDPQVKNLLLYYSLQSQFPDRTPPTGLLRPPREEDFIDIAARQFLEEKEVGKVPPKAAVTGQVPIYIRNRTTGERRVSYDGGVTWQSVGEVSEEERIIRKPLGIKTTPFTREFRGKF